MLPAMRGLAPRANTALVTNPSKTKTPPPPTTTRRPRQPGEGPTLGPPPGRSGPRQPTLGPAPTRPSDDIDLEEGGRLLEYSFEHNVMPSFEAAPDQVRTMAGYIARVYQHAQETGDQEMLDFAIEARSRASNIIPREMEAQYGLDNIEIREDDRNFLSQMKDTALNAAFGDHPIGRFTSAVMSVADRPSQGILTGISALSRGDVVGAAQRVSQGATFGAFGDSEIQAEYDRWDLDNDGVMNLREALHKDPDAGGLWLGTLDTIGVALLDPTTYTGVGASQRARAGLAAVAATQGDDAMRLVARRGTRAVLDDKAMKEVRDYIRQDLAEATAKGRRNQSWARAQLARGTAEEAAEAEAVRRIRNIEKPTGTLRVGGANVNVPGVEQIRDLLSGVRRDASAFRRADGPGRLAGVKSAEGAVESAEAAEGMLSAVDMATQRNSVGGRPGGLAVTEMDDAIWVTKRGDDGEMMGFLNYDTVQDTIDMVMVDPKFRGARIGDDLMDEMRRHTGKSPDEFMESIAKGELTDAGRRSAQRYLDDLGVDSTTPGNLRTAGVGDSIATRVAQSGVGRKVAAVGDAIRPRAHLKRLSAYAEEVFDTARVKAGSRIDNEISDMLRRLDPAMRRATKEVGSIEEADNLIRAALEAKPLDDLSDPIDAEVTRLQGEGLHETAIYLQTVSEIRDRIDNAALEAGLDPERLRQGYFPRTLTEEGVNVIKGSDEAQRQLGLDGARIGGKEGRFQQPRTYKPDLSVSEANTALVADINKGLALDDPLRLADDTQIFEESVAGAFAVRGDAAFRAAAQFDMMRGLAKESIGEGALRKPMVVQRTGPDWTPPAGYSKIDEISDTFYALNDVAEEMRQVRGWMTNDAHLAKTRELLDQWSSVWGAYATTPLLDGLGFHSRNALGNVMLNAIGGVTNPAHYKRALEIQQDMGRVFRAMGDDGIDFDTALDAVVSDESRRGLIRGIRENDIVGGGWFDSLDADDFKPQRVRTTRGYTGVYDALMNNSVIKSGRQLGSAIEHNARITHYIAKLDAPGGTTASAARSTRQFLFDYGDLTQFERSLRIGNRFYTFMRKNTGAQLATLARNPGRIVATERATKGGLGEILGVPDGQVRPDYSEERGDGLDLGGILGLGAEGLVGQVESPFGAMLETMRPLAEIGALVTGTGSGDDVLDSLMDLTAGGPTSLIETIYSQRAQHNFAFDRPFTDTEKGTESRVRSWVEAFVGPAWSQLDSFTSRLSSGEGVGPIGNNASNTTEEFGPELAVLSNIMGLNVAATKGDDEAQRDEYYLLNEELESLLSKLRKEGAGVPTVTELREAGIIPESFDRARSVTLQEDIDWEDDPAKRAEMQADLDEVLGTEAEQGARIESDGSYTTRSDRGKDLSETLGIWVIDDDTGQPKVDDDGELVPSLNSLAMAAYNKDNPDDLFLRDDGTPYDYTHAKVVWPTAREGEVLDWLRENGANIETHRTRITNEMREIYNEHHPNRPQLTVRQRLEAGIRPTQGVYTVIEDGEAIGDVWPEGMSADNWWVEGPTSLNR